MLKNFKIISDYKDRLNLTILFLLLLIATFVELLGIGSVPIFATIIVDPNILLKKLPEGLNFDFVTNLDKKELTLYSSIIILAIFLLKNLFLAFLNYFNGIVQKNLRSNAYNKLFKVYISLDYEFHIQKNPTELIRNITTEVSRAVYYVMGYVLLIKEALIILMIFGLLIIADTTISLILFFVLGFVSFIFFMTTRRGAKIRGKIIQDFWARQIKSLNHGIGSIKQIKILGKQNFMLDIFKTNTKIIEDYNFIQGFIITLPRLFLEVVTISSIVIVSFLFIYSDRLIEDFIPLIALIAVSGARLIPSFNSISQSIAGIKFNSPSYHLIVNELMLSNKDNKVKNDNKTKISFDKSIEIKNLSYKYPQSENFVLENIDLKIQKGEIIGLSGVSGEGKSTLLDLVCGLLKPTKGQIFFDDKDINVKENDWSHIIGYVPQEIYLLDGSIKSNIAFGVEDENFNYKNFENSLKFSQIYNFINSLSEKEMTNVGDNGIRLSGGQKQRIGIARSLYFNPKLLILDEPTSSLDLKNEELILKDIFKLKDKMSIILISHRESAFKICDRIYRLGNKNLKEI